MPRRIEVSVYEFDELDDKAKDRVVEAYRQDLCAHEEVLSDHLREWAQDFLRLLGCEDAVVECGGFYLQGCGARFRGLVELENVLSLRLGGEMDKRGAARGLGGTCGQIRHRFGTDLYYLWLEVVGLYWQVVEETTHTAVTFEVTEKRGCRYVHDNSVEIDMLVEGEYVFDGHCNSPMWDEFEDQVKRRLRKIMQKFFGAFQEDYEWRTSSGTAWSLVADQDQLYTESGGTSYDLNGLSADDTKC